MEKNTTVSIMTTWKYWNSTILKKINLSQKIDAMNYKLIIIENHEPKKKI